MFVLSVIYFSSLVSLLAYVQPVACLGTFVFTSLLCHFLLEVKCRDWGFENKSFFFYNE